MRPYVKGQHINKKHLSLWIRERGGGGGGVVEGGGMGTTWSSLDIGKPSN